MNDRLQELLRQRSLVQEHLAWLDREIVAASGSSAASLSNAQLPSGPTRSPFVTPPAAAILASQAPLPTPEADPVLAEYHQEPEVLAADVKRGCFIYFSVGMAVMFLTVFLIYLHYAHRPTEASAPAPATKAELK